MEYDAYMEAYKHMCSKLIKRDGPFGTHSNRVHLTRQSARHKTLSVAINYKRDAAFLLELFKKRNPEMATHYWKSIFLCCLHSIRLKY
jgi:hypothetical protein